jgi:guanylate kinase
MDACRDVVLEVDIQGARAVRGRVPDAMLIFLQPPSFDALAQRLRGRATEDDAQLSRRIAAAEHEMAQAAWFDHVVVNDEIERAAAQVAAIIGGSDPDA